MNDRKVTTISVPGGKVAGRLVDVGGMLFSSTISGFDSVSGRPGEQVKSAFANLRSLLSEAEVGPAELGLVTVCLADASLLPEVDACWATLFGKGTDQPARKINEYPLPPGELIQIQVIGVKGERRRIIPIPSDASPWGFGARLGNIVFSSAIDGRDPATGMASNDRKVQMRQAFHNMASFVRDAGGSKDDLVHVLIFVRGRDDQKDMLDVWLEEFPVDGKRPARKAIFDETLEREDKIIHLMCVAVLGARERINLEVPGISKRHPNPMGCRIGRLVFSSGIGGDDPHGKETRNTAGVRAALALRNMETLLRSAGGDLTDVGLVSITVNDYADEDAILDEWRRMFPDPENEPARHVMAFGGRGTYPVQLHVIATLGND